MSRTLLRLSFLITMCTSTPFSLPLLHATDIMSPLKVPAILAQSQRTTGSSAAIMATHRRHTRRYYTPGLFVPSAAYRKGVLYKSYENADARDTMPQEGTVITSPSPEARFLRPTNVNSGILSSPTPVAATGSIFYDTFLMPLDISSAGPSFIANLDMSQPSTISHPSLHPAITPAFVGSAMGAVILAALTLVVICRRRIRSRGRSKRSSPGICGWFNSGEKDDVIFIRVPPPTVPLKGILIRNTSLSSATDNVCSDRMSLTSSQMSVIINKLPKSYDSGLEDGVLDEVREHGGSSPIRVATRIGPSQSDFLTNLFGLGNAHSFSSVTSSANGESTLPPSLSSRVLPQSPPQPQRVPAPYSAYELPSLTLVNSPKPTFPPAVASPTLSHTSGPRGHGLVLTGDSNLTPSFAQWHHQRSMARVRDGNLGYGPQF